MRRNRSGNAHDHCNDNDNNDDEQQHQQQYDSNKDDADKMESFGKQRSRCCPVSSSSKDDIVGLPPSLSLLRISFYSRETLKNNYAASPNRMRVRVVAALRRLGCWLSSDPFVCSLEVRCQACVPIVNICMTAGFKVDVALGGHLGTDTLRYALLQTRAHQATFVPVVVALKLLLV